MTTATLVTHGRTMDRVEKPRRSLEELVDRLFDALFAANTETAEPQSVTHSIHEARRLRQAEDVDGALDTLAGMDMGKAETREARWAFSEWKQLVKRRFGDTMLYSQGVGRAAALVPNGGDGTLEVAAVLGMRWQTGRVVSERSLRGLKTLAGGA